jgi:hypothetical protein
VLNAFFILTKPTSIKLGMFLHFVAQEFQIKWTPITTPHPMLSILISNSIIILQPFNQYFLLKGQPD